MKKIVKLTESDLEKIVLRIIKEQSINTPLDGNSDYRLPKIDNNTISKFTNWANGDFTYAMKTLRDLGLRYGNITIQPNPMNVNIKDFKGTVEDNADKLIGMFNKGLESIAITGYVEEKFFKLPIFQKTMNNVGINPNEVAKLFTNYYNVLSGLAKIQNKTL